MDATLIRYLENFLLPIETGNDPNGGYHVDPDDPGGATKWGISKRAYPGLDISALTKDDAIQIYHDDYWARAHCTEFPKPVGIAVMDFAVNSGVHTAICLLQEAIRARVDGKVGPETLRKAEHVSLETLLSVRSASYSRICVTRLIKATEKKYNNPYQYATKYVNGWHNRVFSLYRHINQES